MRSSHLKYFPCSLGFEPNLKPALFTFPLYLTDTLVFASDLFHLQLLWHYATASDSIATFNYGDFSYQVWKLETLAAAWKKSIWQQLKHLKLELQSNSMIYEQLECLQTATVPCYFQVHDFLIFFARLQFSTKGTSSMCQLLDSIEARRM